MAVEAESVATDSAWASRATVGSRYNMRRRVLDTGRLSVTSGTGRKGHKHDQQGISTRNSQWVISALFLVHLTPAEATDIDVRLMLWSDVRPGIYGRVDIGSAPPRRWYTASPL